MYLRAALNLESIGNIAIYSASMFVNYFASLGIFYTLLCHSRNIKTLFTKPSKPLNIATLAIGGTVALTMFVLLVLVASFMFHCPGNS
ncbi:hypothetical protein EV178_004268 [Coemansia sp. RSA 1646]|nr:hypothetical protein EV178_004268 [Coemansia sp. RSA 1646]